MSFEFFFGLFGLISSDSRSRHESRLETDWRLFTPLGASLFREHSSARSTAKPAGPFNLATGEQPSPNYSTGNASSSGEFACRQVGGQAPAVLVQPKQRS